jgi:hypothetical protein
MKKKSIDIEKHFKQVIESIGFHAEKIATSDKGKRADYHVLDKSNTSYIIEVSGKYDNPVYKEILAKDGILERKEVIDWTEAMSSFIRREFKQIRETPDANIKYKLLWIYNMGSDPETQISQFESTLIGKTEILLPKESTKCIPCYYFSYSDFYKRKGLDGVVLSTLKECKLLLNSFSFNADKFRRTEFSNFFREQEALIDPMDGWPKRKYFVIDNFENLNRDSERDVISWLKNKYGLEEALSLKFNVVSATALIRKEKYM